MKIRFLSLIIVILSMLSVCLFAAGTYMVGGNPANTSYFNEDIKMPFKQVFDANIAFTNVNRAQSLVTKNVALAFDADRVFAYDINTGKAEWKYPTDKVLDTPITSNAMSYNGNIYFTTLSILYCLSEDTGKILWRKTIPQTLNTIINVSNDIMYVSTDDKRVYRINAATGEDVATPIVFKSQSSKNNLIIKDNNLIVTNYDNALVCVDLNSPNKEKWSVTIPGTASSYSPVITGNYLYVTSEEQVVLYNISNGREIARCKLPATITAQPVTDGKQIYVGCSNSKIYSLDIAKKLSFVWNGVDTPNILTCFPYISQNELLTVDSKGLMASFDLNTKKTIWTFQPGMYTAGSMTTRVPGMGTKDITTVTSTTYGNNSMGNNQRNGNNSRNSSSRNGGMGGGMAPGGMGGGMAPAGMGGGMAPAGMGGGMAAGGMGVGMGVGMAPGGMGGSMAGGASIMGGGITGNSNKLVDVDLDKYYNDVNRVFVPSPIIGIPSYGDGNLAYVTLDGNLRVRAIDVRDTVVPNTFSYSPGSTDTNKTVSANADILIKMCVFDKGSGIDFKTAKLICTASDDKEYSVHMIYDPSSQTFYGYLRNSNSSSVVTPFADGDMKCLFTLKDYAGNELKKSFTFKVDSSVAVVKEVVPNGTYFDVVTGNLLAVTVQDFNEGKYAQNLSETGGKGNSKGNNTSNSNNSSSGNKTNSGGVTANNTTNSNNNSTSNDTKVATNNNSNTKTNENNSNDNPKDDNTNVGDNTNDEQLNAGGYIPADYNPEVVVVVKSEVDEPSVVDPEIGLPPTPPSW